MIDTNVFVAGLRSGGGASRQVLRRALVGAYLPLFSNALWLEYEDVLGRPIWTEENKISKKIDLEKVFQSLNEAVVKKEKDLVGEK